MGKNNINENQGYSTKLYRLMGEEEFKKLSENPSLLTNITDWSTNNATDSFGFCFVGEDVPLDNFYSVLPSFDKNFDEIPRNESVIVEFSVDDIKNVKKGWGKYADPYSDKWFSTWTITEYSTPNYDHLTPLRFTDYYDPLFERPYNFVPESNNIDKIKRRRELNKRKWDLEEELETINLNTEENLENATKYLKEKGYDFSRIEFDNIIRVNSYDLNNNPYIYDSNADPYIYAPVYLYDENDKYYKDTIDFNKLGNNKEIIDTLDKYNFEYEIDNSNIIKLKRDENKDWVLKNLNSTEFIETKQEPKIENIDFDKEQANKINFNEILEDTAKEIKEQKIKNTEKVIAESNVVDTISKLENKTIKDTAKKSLDTKKLGLSIALGATALLAGTAGIIAHEKDKKKQKREQLQNINTNNKRINHNQDLQYAQQISTYSLV